MNEAERKREYRDRCRIEGKPTHSPDRRKRIRPNRVPHSGSKEVTKWERGEVVGWDGEGYTRADNIHVYNLVCNSDKARLFTRHEGGLTTKQVLDFFLTYGNPKAINVIFSGNYDVNMLLVDLPKEKLIQLHKEGYVKWQGYKIAYANRKKFSVSKLTRLQGGGSKRLSFTLWDVFGFYQSTFVKAVREWIGESPTLDKIAAMKEERYDFSPDRLDSIVKYCETECKLLVQIVNALFDALRGADIKLRRYDGAGAIAGEVLRTHNVKDHKGEIPDEVNTWARYAYSGGRIEAPKIGNEETAVHRYDINSAYPSSAIGLPSYSGATWTFDKEWDNQDCSMVHVEWAYRKAYPFYPLWWRDDNYSIYYPQQGEGIYWGVEFRNLIKYMDPRDYRVLGACNVHLATDYKPFGFLEGMFKERAYLKAVGDKAQVALKLGMNSVYGKLAQQVGFRNGRIPTYHQLLWAGQITADTRAKLYDAAMQSPRSVIAFATDAVITTRPLDLICGKGLGEWDYAEYEGITMVQSGVYWLKPKGASWWDEKYRGFGKGVLDRQHIVGSWVLGMDYEVELTRFISLGSALMSREFDVKWRRWLTESRTLSLTPMGKRMPKTDYCYWDHLCDTVAVSGSYLPCKVSTPYPILWIDGKDEVEKYRAAVLEPMDYSEEVMDAYS